MTHLPIWYIDKLDQPTCTQAFDELKNMGTSVVPSDYWLNHILEHFAQMANTDCGWGYEFSIGESIQFVEKSYDWRIDNPILSGKSTDYKVTVMCLLNDPSEYEGGDLTIRLHEEYIPLLHRGSLIAFPSILEHKVTPVLSGVRYSATKLFSGPRFK
jgi:PKHD-type hydroxylase